LTPTPNLPYTFILTGCPDSEPTTMSPLARQVSLGVLSVPIEKARVRECLQIL
jgi:hypothetical protein